MISSNTEEATIKIIEEKEKDQSSLKQQFDSMWKDTAEQT